MDLCVTGVRLPLSPSTMQLRPDAAAAADAGLSLQTQRCKLYALYMYFSRHMKGITHVGVAR